MFYIWFFIGIIISVLLTMLVEKLLYRIWQKKLKTPVVVTLIFFITLWWVFAVFVNANSR